MATDIKQKEWSAVESALTKLRPLLESASKIVHAYKKEQECSEEDYEYEMTVDRGYLTEKATMLCGPHLMLLNILACELLEIEGFEFEADDADANEQVATH